MRKTTSRLSDGRYLIYYDHDGRPPRVAVDPRSLMPTQLVPEVRLDPLTREWVVIAPHRQERTHLPPSDACPLCPTTPGNQTEIPESDYDVVVFENRFPSLGSHRPAEDEESFSPDRRPAHGGCEVVCFSADHAASFADLTPERVRMIVDVWVDRTRELAGVPGVRQVFAFENRGREIGVTISHPHGQIYAYPFVTPRTQQMIDVARRHYDRTSRNLFADVLKDEQRAGRRIVGLTEHWTAFVPVSARWPVEVVLCPNRVARDLSDLSDAERADFAAVYLDVLRRLDGLYGVAMPYIAAWYQAPAEARPELSYLHLRLYSPLRSRDKLKFLAGSESAMGVFINDVEPEWLADRLRAVGS